MSYSTQQIEKIPRKSNIKVEKDKSFKVSRKAERAGKTFGRYSDAG